MTNGTQPVINYQKTFSDLFYPNSETEGKAREIIEVGVRDILGELAEKVTHMDVTADSSSPEMVVLQHDPKAGTVSARLEVGDQMFTFDDGIDKPEYFKSLMLHELYHLRDRLSDDFAFDWSAHEGMTVPERDRVNAVWDASIERRKLDRHNLRPYFDFDSGGNPRDKVRTYGTQTPEMFLAFFEKSPDVDLVFGHIWNVRKGALTHQELIGLARKLQLRPGVGRSPRST